MNDREPARLPSPGRWRGGGRIGSVWPSTVPSAPGNQAAGTICYDFLLPAGVDGGETVRALLDKERLVPVLVQDFKPVDLDPAGDGAGRGVHCMGWAGRDSPGRVDDPIRALDQRLDVLHLLGADLVPHARPPCLKSDSILQPAGHVQSGLTSARGVAQLVVWRRAARIVASAPRALVASSPDTTALPEAAPGEQPRGACLVRGRCGWCCLPSRQPPARATACGLRVGRRSGRPPVRGSAKSSGDAERVACR
jgi:hypothetical protein